MYQFFFKPFLDYLIAILALLILSPLLVLITLINWAMYGGSVFFIHPRPGKNEQIIKVIKFKTMSNDVDQYGKLLPNDKRITAIGAFLRKYSLDELPQLLNILKGDLSLIGPRPLEIRYLNYYTIDQKRRHSIKPGITGWAQVNGRNNLSWEDKFLFDVWYIENISFKLDLKIIIMSIRKVLKHEGVNYNENNTVIPFDTYLRNKKKG